MGGKLIYYAIILMRRIYFEFAFSCSDVICLLALVVFNDHPRYRKDHSILIRHHADIRIQEIIVEIFYSLLILELTNMKNNTYIVMKLKRYLAKLKNKTAFISKSHAVCFVHACLRKRLEIKSWAQWYVPRGTNAL